MARMSPTVKIKVVIKTVSIKVPVGKFAMRSSCGILMYSRMVINYGGANQNSVSVGVL